jgi:hypothetical protein
MSKKIYYTINLLAFILILQSYIQAQDSISSFNLVQQDSILNNELQLAKKQLYQSLLQNITGIEINQQKQDATYNFGRPMNVYLSVNGLIFVCAQNRNAEILFADLIDQKFKIYSIENNIQSGTLTTTEHKLIIGSTIISVKNDRFFVLKNIAKQFISLQKLHNDVYFKMNEFKQMAILTNAMYTKPAIIEEQRKYIIQAEAFAKLYDYQKAIITNYKLINVHPTAYPNVYLNIAILLAETNKLNSAIYNMKKFMLLNPSNADAQFAKSKITDWEIILNN